MVKADGSGGEMLIHVYDYDGPLSTNDFLGQAKLSSMFNQSLKHWVCYGRPDSVGTICRSRLCIRNALRLYDPNFASVKNPYTRRVGMQLLFSDEQFLTLPLEKRAGMKESQLGLVQVVEGRLRISVAGEANRIVGVLRV